MIDPALLAAIAAVLAVLAGPVGVVLGWWLTHRSQRESWAREDRNRTHSERVQAFAGFLQAMDARLDWLMSVEQRQRVAQITGAKVEIDDYNGPDPEQPLQTIAILAPEVESVADDLWNWSVMQGLHQLQRTPASLGVAVPDEPPWLDVDTYHAKRAAVVAAMRANLGVQ